VNEQWYRLFHILPGQPASLLASCAKCRVQALFGEAALAAHCNSAWVSEILEPARGQRSSVSRLPQSQVLDGFCQQPKCALCLLPLLLLLLLISAIGNPGVLQLARGYPLPVVLELMDTAPCTASVSAPPPHRYTHHLR
jgi:hypothetical protein